jgi:hypothetical protein
MEYRKTVITRLSSLSWDRLIQPLSLRSILISPTHILVCLMISFLMSFPPISYMYSSHLLLLDLITLIILEEYKLWSFSLGSFLQPTISSLLGPDILSILFSNTLSLCSTLNFRDQISHPYRTTGKIIVSYICTFTILDKRQVKRFWTEC